MSKLLAGVPVICGSKFTWDVSLGGNHVGVADYTDIQPVITARLYADACDVGFIVKSHKTGKEVAFTFSQELLSSDGEVTAWVFESADRKVDIHIIND